MEFKFQINHKHSTNITTAHFSTDLPEVLAIFREYVTNPSASLDFQGFETELPQLPGKYAAPDSCVAGAAESSF